MTISFPPQSVSSERAKKYDDFILDEEMPIEVREFAQKIYIAYSNKKDVGPIMAGELTLQMIRFLFADPIQQMQMTARGETLRTQLELEELAARRKRERRIT